MCGGRLSGSGTGRLSGSGASGIDTQRPLMPSDLPAPTPNIVSKMTLPSRVPVTVTWLVRLPATSTRQSTSMRSPMSDGLRKRVVDHRQGAPTTCSAISIDTATGAPPYSDPTGFDMPFETSSVHVVSPRSTSSRCPVGVPSLIRAECRSARTTTPS